MNNPSIITFFDKIEEVLIKDETLMRLLKYPPKDATNPDPLDPVLPNVVDEFSDEYWNLVDEKFVKGSQKTEVEEDSTVIICMYEGRNRPVLSSYILSKQEIRFGIIIHEDYEVDRRISRISARIADLISNRPEFVGYGALRPVGKNPSSAPVDFRRQEDIYTYMTNSRDGHCRR